MGGFSSKPFDIIDLPTPAFFRIAVYIGRRCSEVRLRQGHFERGVFSIIWDLDVGRMDYIQGWQLVALGVIQ